MMGRWWWGLSTVVKGWGAFRGDWWVMGGLRGWVGCSGGRRVGRG
jgi:hypothetical protein